MNIENYIGIEGAQIDRSIYRIFSLSRLEQIMRDKNIALVKPKMWDDPFENALLSASFLLSNGERGSVLSKDSVYGQCWTLHRETDAMWRIYSHDKDGVRVTTTPRKLLEALSQTDPDCASFRAFIGKVRYLKKTALLEKLGGINIFDSSGKGIAESLLYKRNEFRHEAEVRLVYNGPDMHCVSDFYQMPIDPNLLFDKILFDPRMDDGKYKAGRAMLRRLGYSGLIGRSGLYRAPKDLVFNI